MSRVGTKKVSPKTAWSNIGSLTTEQAALGVTGRDDTTVEALTSTGIIIHKPVGEPYAFLIRFRSDGSEDDDSVIQVYAARGSDDYHRVAQLTITQGQQIDSGSIYFNDTITPASEDALFDGEESNLANMIAHYYMRTLGFDRFLFIASDLDTTTIYIDVANLYE